ncbi:MAG: hypothetical protein V1820_02330 [archaeon]
MARQIAMNLTVNEYASRVLGVIKERYGLRDKAAALEKFAELYGTEFVEPEVNEETVREIVESCNAHVKKHGMRKLSLKELDRLSGAD